MEALSEALLRWGISDFQIRRFHLALKTAVAQ